MRKFTRALLGIDQGELELFSEYDTGGDMWTGSGKRERRTPVLFSEPFAERPVVQVAVTLWDVDKSANFRADISADAITRDGFDLVLRTWSDTRIARIRMQWSAFGAVLSEDDWLV